MPYMRCKYFKAEKIHVIKLIEHQNNEIKELSESGKKRLADIEDVRLKKNKEVVSSIENIISAIENDGLYKGNEPKFTKMSLTHE